MELAALLSSRVSLLSDISPRLREVMVLSAKDCFTPTTALSRKNASWNLINVKKIVLITLKPSRQSYHIPFIYIGIRELAFTVGVSGELFIWRINTL